MYEETGEGSSMLRAEKCYTQRRGKNSVGGETEGKQRHAWGEQATGERIAFVSARPQIIHEHFYQFSSRTSGDRSWTRGQNR